ncbi:TonB-dependent receptor [Rhizosaccharibacter radicis]|uniref:TonB-dependent receptor n=1 Tax=Rhizosaccharibacter radicis TaxID=2782605 RepID=A0ABT1VYE0_9PROT|nr:TonB-dependent receptor [Acetobacteraceae bacterium KSS12]
MLLLRGRAACLLTSTALISLTSAAFAQNAGPHDKTDPNETVTVVSHRSPRSAVSVTGAEIQKILPGTSPLRALQTLPGVTFETADPWGNNEQNITLFVHGFNQQQLGYTLDDVPLGDQNYGNYNGLSPQRAVISENVARVTLNSGAGDLATASTSNLGGTIETFTSDPKHRFGGTVGQTFGSFSTFRTYARVDTGDFGNGNAAYVSFARQDARAWDFQGHQGGYQVNAKFVHDAGADRVVAYFDYSDKTEPNEDSIVHVAGESGAPYVRPFTYPDFRTALNYLSANGATPAADGSNYRNYFSDAQRTDYLSYLRWEHRFGTNLTWTNQLYFHHDDGVGVVAGPISAAGLPALFSVYYPGQNLRQIFGGTGYATRTTEYEINRGGYLTALDWTLGNHRIEIGGWVERNSASAFRRWYPLELGDPLTPYDRPSDPLITQYGSQIDVTELQTHIEDNWRILPGVMLAYGFKSSMQFAHGDVPVQPKLGSLVGSTGLPVGTIDTTRAFLPEIGATWDVTKHEQLFANVQKNVRQYMTYGAGGLSPWSLGSQQAFDLFKRTGEPETSWTYEVGLRSQRSLRLGPITGFDGQAEYYHVDFSNRLLSISPTPVISSIVGGAAIIANVGSVTTDGVDLAGTLHFGPHLSAYDAISYNDSRYDDDYMSGRAVVSTAGRKVPASPEWLNKSVISANWGAADAQLIGDYVGPRYATYTNDLSVKSYFLLSLEAGYRFRLPKNAFLRDLYVQGNITNLNNQRGVSTLVVGAASGTYNTYPIAPRMYFLTLTTHF